MSTAFTFRWRLISQLLMKSAVADAIGTSIVLASAFLVSIVLSVLIHGVPESERIQGFLTLLIALLGVAYGSLVLVYLICGVCCSLGWIRLGAFKQDRRELHQTRLLIIALRTVLAIPTVVSNYDLGSHNEHRFGLRCLLLLTHSSFLHGHSPQLE